MARPYRSRLRPRAISVLAMITAATGAAILLAIGWQHLDHYGELLLARSILPALLIGSVLAWVAQRSEYSWPRSAALIASVATLLAIAGTQLVEHRQQRTSKLQDMHKRVVLSISFGSDPDELWLEYNTERSAMTFQRYLQRRFGSGGNATDGAAAWFGTRIGVALYCLELALAALVAGLLVATKAKEPACQHCGRWSQESVLAGAAYGEGRGFVDDLIARRHEAATEKLSKPDTQEQILFSLALCPSGHDASTGVLRLRERCYDSRGRTLLTRYLADLELEENEQDLLRAKLGEWS